MKKKMILAFVISLLTIGAALAIAMELVTRETGGKYEVGIKIVKGNQVIENHVFKDIPIGIAVWSSNNLIVNCTFINCSDEGILLIGSNNIVENCVFYQCCDGIELQRSSNNTFINCRFLSNTHAGIDGIISSNNYNSFISCVFYDNMMGVYFSQSQNITFDDCLFVDNKEDKVGCD